MVSISELAERYTEDLAHRDVTEGHRCDLLGNLDRALTRMGVQDVRDLTKERIRRFLKQVLDRGNSARSHNGYRSALLDFCAWLKAYDQIKEIPVVVKPKNERDDRRRRSRALTLAEVDALLEAVPNDRRRALYLFRVHTGLRCREASRVKWSDFDLAHRVLALRGRGDVGGKVTKNRKPDLLPLTVDTCEALVELQREALRTGRSLGVRPFPTVPAGRTWDRDLDLAEIARRTADGQADRKCLRTTFTSFLLHAEVDPIDVTLLMRHRLPGGMDLTLGTYGDGKALLHRKFAAVDQMSRWIENQRKKAKQKSKKATG